jgi:hypothetical protein
MVAMALGAAPGSAWTPRTQEAIATEGLRLAPPDLRRQMERHKKAYRRGVLAPFSGSPSDWHVRNQDRTGRLHVVIVDHVDRAIEMIQSHRPFAEVVEHLGRLAHYVADANDPLRTSSQDSSEGRYRSDFHRYAESAEPRIALVFYTQDPQVESPQDVKRLVATTLVRGRRFYPYLGLEYQRIGYRSGTRYFDDRSTAFALASLSFSHAVTDLSRLLSYIWVTAGGRDERSWTRDSGMVRLSRAASEALPTPDAGKGRPSALSRAARGASR